MKKIIMYSLVLVGVLVLTKLLAGPSLTQNFQNGGDDKKQLPPEVISIVEKSCYSCHANPAKGLPLSLLNFSKWNELSAKKQASKAKSICNLVSKGKMPPKGFLEKHPEATLTKDEIKVLCDWAESLKVVKK